MTTSLKEMTLNFVKLDKFDGRQLRSLAEKDKILAYNFDSGIYYEYNKTDRKGRINHH